MKPFVKAFDKTGQRSQYLVKKFPKVSEAKLKDGVFDGPQIITMFRNTAFVNTMNRFGKKPGLVLRQWDRTFWEIRKVLNTNKSLPKRLQTFERSDFL